MQKVPIIRQSIRQEPSYVKRWKGKPEPDPKYSPMWINWKRANFPSMTLKEVIQEALLQQELENK